MKIALIMLAAGNSRRFGSNKLLYEIDGNCSLFFYYISCAAALQLISAHPLPKIAHLFVSFLCAFARRKPYKLCLSSLQFSPSGSILIVTKQISGKCIFPRRAPCFPVSAQRADECRTKGGIPYYDPLRLYPYQGGHQVSCAVRNGSSPLPRYVRDGGRSDYMV